MDSFEKAVEFILAHEGGYSNDANDPGGETNWGISKRSYPSADIKALTRDQAIDIYRRDYWDRCKCGNMPGPIGFLLFDAAVNQGASGAIRLLQKALRVNADGIIGPVTMQQIQLSKTRQIAVAFVARRAFAYAQNVNVIRFGLGWFNRLAEAHQRSMEER